MNARPAVLLKIPALLAAIVALLFMTGISSPASAAAAAAATNGVDRAANLVSRDKWTRTEPSFGHSTTSDDDDDDDDDDSSSSKTKTPPVEHKGELNGDLKLKAW